MQGMKGIQWIATVFFLIFPSLLGAQATGSKPSSKQKVRTKAPSQVKPTKIPGLEAPLSEPLRIQKNLRSKLNPKGGGSVEVLGALRGPIRKDAPDPIAALLMRIGGMEAWLRIGELQASYLLQGFNARGEELFSKRIEHRALLDPSNPQDEIVWFQDSSNGGLRYGRNGARVWVRTSGVDRPDLEKRMAPEVERWGELLRFPFNFADRTKYSLGREERVRLLGKAYQRIRLYPRKHLPEGQVIPVGPLPLQLEDLENWIDLYLDPATHLPLLLEMKVGGHRRRITLGDWRKIPGSSVRIPFERTFLDEDGETQSLRVKIHFRDR